MALQYEALLELVKGRRTVRAIRSDPLPDDTVERLVEVARWAPTGFNMQPAEFVVVRDPGLRKEIKRIVDDWIEQDFFALEATREEWQGPPWTAETHGRPECPLGPLYILITGDTRRRAGLPMNVRLEKHKGDSIFESSLSNAFVYLWLAVHSLGLAAQPVSAVKGSKVQGLVRHLLGLPDFIHVFEMLAVGYSAMEAGPAAKLTRRAEEMVHYDRAGETEFPNEEELRREIRKLRAGNVARHREASRLND
ncbi:MAG: nitroreductase family protein [Thermoleophilia bacterium]|nr:nitroreductase family protein [Thermoleophilia bacterium]